jgi:4-amino-4-deoxy-L-arabinose transferase-like glycosyltransferase
MDDPNRAPMQSTLTLTARVGWAALIVVTLYVCYFSHLGALGFVGPDEPRYAWVAREMVESGDWVTPRLYGKPWFEKPVLYYWGAALSFKVFGVSEASARLPSAISALLATLAMAWLAWRIYGVETARWLLLLLPTTVGMIGFSHAAAMDMPFAGMLTIAMVGAAVVLGLVPPSPSSSFTSFTPSTSFSSFLFGVFLGAAALAKGPAALILCSGAVLFWALFTRRWRDAFRLLHPAAIASFCVTALPWYILCARRNPDFFRVFIIEHNFQRYLTPEFRHVQPFWYYGPIVLIAMLPWTGPWLWAVGISLKKIRRGQTFSPGAALLLGWAVFCVAFFSFSKSKLPGYVLPAIPPLLLLLANSLAKMTQQELRILRGPAFSICLATGAAQFGFLRYFSRYGSWGLHHRGELALYVFIGLSFLPLIGSIVMGLMGRVKAAAIFSAVVMVFLVELSNVGVMPGLERFLSAREAARLFQPFFSNGEPIFFNGAQRAGHFQLSFYLHQELPRWEPKAPRAGLVIVEFGAQKEFEQEPIRLRKENAVLWLALYRVAPLPSATELTNNPRTNQK